MSTETQFDKNSLNLINFNFPWLIRFSITFDKMFTITQFVLQMKDISESINGIRLHAKMPQIFFVIFYLLEILLQG